jgi:hypothetical protein
MDSKHTMIIKNTDHDKQFLHCRCYSYGYIDFYRGTYHLVSSAILSFPPNTGVLYMSCFLSLYVKFGSIVLKLILNSLIFVKLI